MRIRVADVELRQSTCRTRLPFRFGSTTMTRAPLLCVRTEVEAEPGAPLALGYAGDLLVPRWFDKDPRKTLEDNQRDLVASARAAARAILAAGTGTARELGAAANAAVTAGTAPLAPIRLLQNFGVALVERSILDAVARAAGTSFHSALRTGLYGLEPRVADTLPPHPASDVAVRHTVGMADALRRADIDPTHAREDGLPQALEEDVRTYGLRLFKIKIGAGRELDRERLLAVHRVLAETAPADWQCSLDANEQYEDLEALEGLLDDLMATPAGRDLHARLLHLEQPLPRSTTFATTTAPAVARLARRVPLLIDEADVDAGAFAAARALGYTGVSMKNCKGVLRAVETHASCVELRRRGFAAFQSAEDLTNLAVLPLQQDLATIMALGLPHAERNGHHYFAGLDHLPPSEAAAAARAHPDLYRAREGGGFALRIEGGRIAAASLSCIGYGYACAIDFAAREPV